MNTPNIYSTTQFAKDDGHVASWFSFDFSGSLSTAHQDITERSIHGKFNVLEGNMFTLYATRLAYKTIHVDELVGKCRSEPIPSFYVGHFFVHVGTPSNGSRVRGTEEKRKHQGG